MSNICVFAYAMTVIAAEVEPINESIITVKPDGATDSSQETLKEDDSQPIFAAYVVPAFFLAYYAQATHPTITRGNVNYRSFRCSGFSI